MNKNLGQYFTPRQVAAFMLSLSRAGADAAALEPSAGEGVFIDLLRQRGVARIDGYEIDPTLAARHECVKCASFVSADAHAKYDLVIGNPPYIRRKNLDAQLKAELDADALWGRHFNALCDYSLIFMLKGIEALKDGGELIFICPEYWTCTTNSQSLRDYFCEHGYFSDFFMFNETPVFKGATVATVVFRFVKSRSRTQGRPPIRVAKFTRKSSLSDDVLDRLLSRTPVPGVEYLELPQFRKGERWVFAQQGERADIARLEAACEIDAPGSRRHRMATLGDVCEIGNGMVSGLDRAFRIPDGTSLNEAEARASIPVYKAKDLVKYWTVRHTQYINVPEDVVDERVFKRRYPHFHALMQPHRDALLSRYSYGRELPYWQWSFRRNARLFGGPGKRIFVPCKERISAKPFVRFALADEGFYSTQDVTGAFMRQGVRESIEYILAYLNSPQVFRWIRHCGIVKGNIVEFSERPLAGIPFRRIRWNDAREARLHGQITRLTAAMVASRDLKASAEIDNLLGELMK